MAKLSEEREEQKTEEMEFRKLTEEETEKVFSLFDLESRDKDIFTAIDTKVGVFVVGVYMNESKAIDEDGVAGLFIEKCVTQILINKDGVAEIVDEWDALGRVW